MNNAMEPKQQYVEIILTDIEQANAVYEFNKQYRISNTDDAGFIQMYKRFELASWMQAIQQLPVKDVVYGTTYLINGFEDYSKSWDDIIAYNDGIKELSSFECTEEKRKKIFRKIQSSLTKRRSFWITV